MTSPPTQSATTTQRDQPASASIVPAEPTHILVSDFDAVHQASMWRRYGAKEATRRLVSVLRTAILLGEELTIDRNQLFDGIFFLALGPAGVANALGLAPDDPLPITVSCQPGLLPDDDGGAGFRPDASGSFSSGGDERQRANNAGPRNRCVPIKRGAEVGFSGVVSVDFQLDWVRSERFLTASSAMMAAAGDTASNSWLASPPSQEWFEGCGLSRFETPLTEEQIVECIQVSQDEWAQAMVDGRVAVDRWDRNVNDDLNVPEALMKTRNELEGSLDELRPLAKILLAEKSNVRKDAVQTAVDWMGEQPSSSQVEEARMAMEMWSRAYYRAIAHRDGAMYLSFYDSVEDSDLARSYGLSLPARSRFQRLRDRAFSVRRAETIRVEGEILDHMLVIAPGAFSQLYLLTRNTARELITQGKAQAMFDLAYAAREAVREPDSHSHKRFVTALKVLTMTVMAVVVAALGLLTDLTDLSTTAQVMAIVGAAFLGMLAGLPWDDFAELFRLRRAKMTATLTLSNQEISA